MCTVCLIASSVTSGIAFTDDAKDGANHHNDDDGGDDKQSHHHEKPNYHHDYKL